ncbi:MAG: hypothetical protein K8S62_07855 [Candidatus Sabulitectum sp.]|nr:hypothetical protein [Candidatus Sabulitectum sp.]
MLSLLIFAFVSDTAPIHTTAADSSHVSFIAQTPLTWEMVEHDSLRYIRFTGTSVSDSIGYPELPMITCLVAVPDSVTPALEFALSSITEETVNPVYPAPAQILSDQYSTVAIVDSFVQDSTAYLSDEFWPAERVRIIGETRICDQRLLKIQLFPAQYRASDSTLSTVSSFSVSVSFDSASAVWSDIGLGAFQRMVSGSPILGYHEVEQTHVPVPVYFGKVDPENGPSRMPDYVIICASGLFVQCKDAIEDLADHRVSLNGFDVALVTTGDILVDFGSGQSYITDDIIRDFTEHMWNNWSQASIKKPEYLLLIGDHEDSSFAAEDWFLPTHEYDDYIGLSFIENIGNDEWYAYFNDDTDINNDFPDMMVGRLSVKNGSTIQTDTISTLIQNLIDLEDPIQQAPLVDNRRRILRLTGTGDDDGTGYQTPKDWGPGTGWTLAFTDWLGYDYSTNYCGDGREFTTGDGSTLWSEEWVDDCIYEFKKGAGVAFYSDHGEYHMFSAGLEWLDIYIPQDLHTMGSRDSTFNNYQIEQNLQTPSINYAAPFVLQLCCSSGTYNHTLQRHNDRTSHREFCYYDGWGAPPIPPLYNFGSDCLAEKMFKNTAVPVAGVFASSQPSAINDYEWYGKGILEGIYARGFGRLGDAIASARTINIDYFESFGGDYKVGIAQFNLLGDPALDISDRVRYPNKCDLEIYEADIQISKYPRETVTGMDIPITFTVQNNGNQESDEYDVRITVSHGTNVNVSYLYDCDEIPSRGSVVYEHPYTPSSLSMPIDVTVKVEVDFNEDCNDSWWGNNEAEATVQLVDTYPTQSGWPIAVDGVITTTPVLTNLDSDSELEIVALTGTSLTAFDIDGDKMWEVTGESFQHTVHPLAADLDEDGNMELLLACGDDEIKVISHQGDLLYTLEDASEVFAVGNMYSSSGLELCVGMGNSLDLYSWDSSNDEFDPITSKNFGYPMTRNSISLVCADLGGSQTYQDVIYLNGGFDPSGGTPQPEKKTIEVYNWSTSSSVYSKTWNEYVNSVVLAAGTLADITSIGYSARSYNGSSGDPAQIIEPGEAIEEVSCSNTDVLQTARLIQGVFADWTATPGADTYVLPSERQCLAWDNAGDPFNGFPTAFPGAVKGSLNSLASLGDLNGDGDADVLFSTELSGDYNLLAYGSDGEPLDDNLSFPYILPEDVSALGGFAIADIDRDNKVEIVFGTSEGLLHCWELESCATGYAPWPQFQHDSGRTGVLE